MVYLAASAYNALNKPVWKEVNCIAHTGCLLAQQAFYISPVIAVAGRAADVKRCYSSRGALALLDFDDPSIQGVQALMVRAAMLPPFLRCADGRKFVAHLFTLHVSL